MDQFSDPYIGRITNWSEIGGPDAEIDNDQRRANSGTQALMEQLVKRGEKMHDSPNMILMLMMGLFGTIWDDPPDIGYSVYFTAANNFTHVGLRMVAVEGATPATETI